MKKRKLYIPALLLMLVVTLAATALGSRFPHPEFESGYVRPSTEGPEPLGAMADFIDLGLLAAALALATYFIHKSRSRRAIYALMVVCLVYFGFIRNGCICPIGSIQNVVAALASDGYTLSIAVLGFFLLPLVSALFSGRTFCSSVCPLGGIQDVVAIKPLKVPWQISRTLGIIPYIFLGLAVLLAWTESAFIVCRMDPFVAFFRMSGEMGMVVFGGLLLLIGIFVARPYCRFLCPYGVLLGWASRFSKSHLSITPADCIQCRLCEDSCPFDAIRKPVPSELPEDFGRARRRLIALIALAPLIVVATGWLGAQMHAPLSRLNNTVILAEQVFAEDAGLTDTTTLRSESFRELGDSTDDLYAEAMLVRASMRRGGWLFGGFVGLAIAGGLIKYSIRRTRTDYEPDRIECLSCGRCLSFCPVRKPLSSTAESCRP